jgi:hypothetical protein
MSSIPNSLDNWLKDGAEVVSLTRRPRSAPQKYLSASGTLFCYRLSNPKAHSEAGSIR